jgi:hypothetical protein
MVGVNTPALASSYITINTYLNQIESDGKWWKVM